jgi:hypothetical protein
MAIPTPDQAPSPAGRCFSGGHHRRGAALKNACFLLDRKAAFPICKNCRFDTSVDFADAPKRRLPNTVWGLPSYESVRRFTGQPPQSGIPITHEGAKKKNDDHHAAAPVSARRSTDPVEFRAPKTGVGCICWGRSTPTRDVPFPTAGDVPAASKRTSVSYGGQIHRRTLANCVSARKGRQKRVDRGQFGTLSRSRFDPGWIHMSAQGNRKMMPRCQVGKWQMS